MCEIENISESIAEFLDDLHNGRNVEVIVDFSNIKWYHETSIRKEDKVIKKQTISSNLIPGANFKQTLSVTTKMERSWALGHKSYTVKPKLKLPSAFTLQPLSGKTFEFRFPHIDDWSEENSQTIRIWDAPGDAKLSLNSHTFSAKVRIKTYFSGKLKYHVTDPVTKETTTEPIDVVALFRKLKLLEEPKWLRRPYFLSTGQIDIRCEKVETE